MLESAFLNFDFSIFTDSDHKKNSVSSVQTKIFKENSEFPKSYCLENTKVHQLWWSDQEINFKVLSDQLNFNVKTVSSILIPPGSCIPLHSDTFHKLKNEFPIDAGKMVRAVIYASEYDIGQFTQYINDRKIHTYTNWAVGDGHIWDNQVPHVTANASYKDLITVNISGFKL